MSSPKTTGRMINKGISNSQKFALLSPEAAVLFAMLIPHYNSYGKMNGGSGFIKDEVCPLVPYLTYKNIPKLLKEISEKTNVKHFIHNGRYWIHSTSFLEKHQTLKTYKMGSDLLPNYSGLTPEYSGLTHELVPHEVEVEVKVEVEDKGTARSTPSGKKPDIIPFEIIVLDFNKKAGTGYKSSSKKTQDFIRARWNEGFREKDFFKVHDHQCAKWLTDVKMKEYLRPETIYGTKFEGYLNNSPPNSKTSANETPIKKPRNEAMEMLDRIERDKKEKREPIAAT